MKHYLDTKNEVDKLNNQLFKTKTTLGIKIDKLKT